MASFRRPEKEQSIKKCAAKLAKSVTREKSQHTFKATRTRGKRVAPEGEDLEKIKDILRDLKGQNITVHEFVGLVSPYTGDKGEVLRKVMTEELVAFRNMVNRIYDTMTQDVGDVIANEQVQLQRMYAERHILMGGQLQRAMRELHYYNPDFDFREYYHNKYYLDQMFEVPEELDEDAIEEERRHQAFHRMQWLRSEGERLKAENEHLQKKLNMLRKQQKQEAMRSVQRQSEIVQQTAELEETEAQMKERLEEVADAVDRSIVATEHTETVARKKSAAKLSTKQKTRKVKRTKKEWQDLQLPEWNVQTAAEIEEQNILDVAQANASVVAARAASPPRDLPSPKRTQRGEYRVEAERSETTVIQPLPQQRPLPPPQQSPPSPQRLVHTEQVEREVSATRIVETRQQPEPQSFGRRVHGPRDSWAGYYDRNY